MLTVIKKTLLSYDQIISFTKPAGTVRSKPNQTTIRQHKTKDIIKSKFETMKCLHVHKFSGFYISEWHTIEFQLKIKNYIDENLK